MSDKNTHIDENDLFSELVKNKLENHQMPVDESLWAGIEQQLAAVQTKRKRPVAYWQWIASGVAAVIALALLTYKPQNSPLQAPTLSQQQEQSADTGSKPVISDKEPASYLSDIENTKSPQSAPVASSKKAGLFSQNNQSATLAEKSDKALSPVSEQKKETDVSEGLPQEKEDTPIQPKQETEVKGAGTEKSTEPNPYRNLDKLPDLNDYPDLPEYTEHPKKKQPLLIAAAFGAGNSQSNLSGSKDQGTQRIPNRQLVNKKELTASNPDLKTTKNFSNAQHYAPISVGVRVEMPLTNWFSLETGLTYTYLKSILKGGGDGKDNDAKLESHYLGIPLNLRAKMINGSRWNVYGSIGGMIEKGVRSSVDQIIENSHAKTTSTRVNYTIDGFQWSLNGAVGAEYKINRDLRIFIEPQITYYLENNQPFSARTVQPLNLGLNGGLRIEL